MNTGAAIVRGMNHLFPKQKHPFNLRNDGTKTYAEWQYDMGEKTIEYYLKYCGEQEMFQGKDVLDMGCGAAGKTLFYGTLGAKRLVGVDMVSSYQREAETLAQKLGLSDRFSFVAADAAHLPFASGTFDTIIMNDFMEHIGTPEAALTEAVRLLRPGGRLFINFPPYYHPFGAHLSDVIGIPWVHVLFPEQTLICAYKALTADLPDQEERLALRISTNPSGKEYFSYINHMTVKRFENILKTAELTPAFYEEVPLRRFLWPLAKSPAKELFLRMVVCIIEKPSPCK